MPRDPQASIRSPELSMLHKEIEECSHYIIARREAIENLQTQIPNQVLRLKRYVRRMDDIIERHRETGARHGMLQQCEAAIGKTRANIVDIRKVIAFHQSLIDESERKVTTLKTIQLGTGRQYEVLQGREQSDRGNTADENSENPSVNAFSPSSYTFTQGTQ